MPKGQVFVPRKELRCPVPMRLEYLIGSALIDYWGLNRIVIKNGKRVTIIWAD